jgi:hypothetical protein
MAIKQTNKMISTMAAGNPIGRLQPKTIAAVILVAVMAVLWVRVLFRSGADTALANPSAANIDSAPQEDVGSGIKIKTVDLTEIPGRHDKIAADFFRADRCSVWSQKTTPAVPSTALAESQKMLNELTRAIALEAIIKDAQGNAEKASINGTLVSVGSVLQINVRNENHSVRVMTIESGHVQLNWQGRPIDMEMPDQKVN